MHFQLTEEQEMIRDAAREFATREIAPLAPELDREQRHSPEIVTGHKARCSASQPSSTPPLDQVPFDF